MSNSPRSQRVAEGVDQLFARCAEMDFDNDELINSVLSVALIILVKGCKMRVWTGRAALETLEKVQAKLLECLNAETTEG